MHKRGWRFFRPLLSPLSFPAFQPLLYSEEPHPEVFPEIPFYLLYSSVRIPVSKSCPVQGEEAFKHLCPERKIGFPLMGIQDVSGNYKLLVMGQERAFAGFPEGEGKKKSALGIPRHNFSVFYKLKHLAFVLCPSVITEQFDSESCAYSHIPLCQLFKAQDLVKGVESQALLDISEKGKDLLRR